MSDVAAGRAAARQEFHFQPHRRWYKRREVLVPVILVLIGYALLLAIPTDRSFFRTRITPDGASRWDWMYFWHLIPLMLRGLLVTAKGTVLGFSVSIVLGLFLALGRRSARRIISWPAIGVIEFIRSTPLLVQLYFGLVLVRASDAINLGPVAILMVVLGLHYATYCSEAYRAGINSVPAGQWEAATALNLSGFTTWTRIIIPQAVPNVLPALGNFLVAGFKDAPLAAILGVPGILAFATTVRNEDFRAQEPLIMAGVGFLTVSLIAAWAVRRLEEKITYERT